MTARTSPLPDRRDWEKLDELHVEPIRRAVERQGTNAAVHALTMAGLPIDLRPIREGWEATAGALTPFGWEGELSDSGLALAVRDSYTRMFGGVLPSWWWWTPLGVVLEAWQPEGWWHLRTAGVVPRTVAATDVARGLGVSERTVRRWGGNQNSVRSRAPHGTRRGYVRNDIARLVVMRWDRMNVG